MEIQPAKDSQARSIARLIMQAMNYDCCRYFAGPDHTLDDFERMMTSLVQSEKSQYSYLNAIVAVDEDGGEPCGVCISYDGARLHELREAFVNAARDSLGRDFGSMADKYIIMMQILETKKVQDLDVATRVAVQLQLTDPELRSRDRVVKKSEKNSLYAAMDVAAVWLDRALASK